MWEHKNKLNPHSFTSRYNINKLVYYEYFTNITAAIAREKQIKGWVRAKKMALIESMNKDWRDLAKEWDGFRHYERSEESPQKRQRMKGILHYANAPFRMTVGVSVMLIPMRREKHPLQSSNGA